MMQTVACEYPIRASHSTEFQTVEFLRRAIQVLVPSFKGASYSRKSTGNFPWDFEKQERFGSPSLGFDLTMRGEAFDTSTGPRESCDTTVRSYGLSDGAKIEITFSEHYNNPSPQVRISITASEAEREVIVSLSRECFG